MAVPDFQSILLPLLEYAASGSARPVSDAADALAMKFSLTADDLAEVLPSGRQTRFYNRVGWAKTYLSQAKLLTGQRGIVEITERGRELLKENPSKIDLALLGRYPEIVEFRARRAPAGSPNGEAQVPESSQTPEERIAESHEELKQSLIAELLDQVKQRSPQFFENLVIDLLVRMGYGGSRPEAAQRIGRSGDGGIDGVINEDKLGLDVVYVQAKRWQGTVGRPEVQAFAGSLAGRHANKGIMLTTSRFSPDAEEFVRSLSMKVVLIDGRRLADYMLEYGVGVSDVATYKVMRIALDELDYVEQG